ncbi:hypothetical protein AB0I84_13095 [Streptomyces spectabilis]|uniref:hypothetical protein n=1 Tax=Streptomyces spectabilis TaxID=68270 RepID=UPI0033D1A507
MDGLLEDPSQHRLRSPAQDRANASPLQRGEAVRGSRDLEHLVRDLPAIERWHDLRGRAAQRVISREIHAFREMEHYNREIRLLPEGTAQVADWNLWKDEAFRVQALGLIEDRRRELMAARDRDRYEREEARRLERIAKQA